MSESEQDPSEDSIGLHLSGGGATQFGHECSVGSDRGSDQTKAYEIVNQYFKTPYNFTEQGSLEDDWFLNWQMQTCGNYKLKINHAYDF